MTSLKVHDWSHPFQAIGLKLSHLLHPYAVAHQYGGDSDGDDFSDDDDLDEL